MLKLLVKNFLKSIILHKMNMFADIFNFPSILQLQSLLLNAIFENGEVENLIGVNE